MDNGGEHLLQLAGFVGLYRRPDDYETARVFNQQCRLRARSKRSHVLTPRRIYPRKTTPIQVRLEQLRHYLISRETEEKGATHQSRGVIFPF